MKILFLFFTIALVGCSLSALDGGSIEKIDGTYRFEFKGERGRYWGHRTQPDTPMSKGPYVFYFTLPKPRFVRYLYAVVPEAPVRDVSVQVRRTEKMDWELIKQIKSPITSTTRIDINRRAIEIRLVQKTVSRSRRATEIRLDSRTMSVQTKLGEGKRAVITGFEVYVQQEGER